MSKILEISQIVIAILLVVLILLQQRSAGLSSAFGGLGEFYGTRRGLEKNIFTLTVIAAGFFILIALLNLVI